MAGRDQQGGWRLFVSEPNETEIGRVNSWTLIAAAGAPLGGLRRQPRRPGASVVLDASASARSIRRHHALRVGSGRRTGFREGATPTTATRTVIAQADAEQPSASEEGVKGPPRRSSAWRKLNDDAR
jgi:hypothetical protein